MLVNIAGYQLFAENSGDMALRLPVIVGKLTMPHPCSVIAFAGLKSIRTGMCHRVSRPMRCCPSLRKTQTISLNNICGFTMPGLIRGVSSRRPVLIGARSTRAQMRRYAIKQDPGAWNALGKLKFVFPNSYNVYLHDTSAPELFAQQERLFSHGCIRVSSPDRLAAFLLDSPNEPW